MKTIYGKAFVIATVCLGVPAAAAVVTGPAQTWSCTLSSGGGQQGCRAVLQQFNPALGTLQSVTITGSGSATGTAYTAAVLGQQSVTWTLADSFVLDIANSAFALGTGGTQTTVTAGTSGVQSTLNASLNPFTIQDTNLAGFVGTGQVLYMGLTLPTLTPSFNPLAVTAPLSTGASLSGTISYVYNATAAVPEPATWATMIVGFGLVGAAVRRRRAAGTRQLAD